MSASESDVYGLIAVLLERGEPFSIATVVRTADVTSAKAGAKAVVLGDGTVRGYLGGACVEGAVRRTAAAALESGQPRLIRIKPTDQVV